jgi:PAS domain S-box-containing protein
MSDRGPTAEEELQLLSRAELEEQVRQRTSELEQVTEAMADILIKLDEEGNISMINESVTDILGHEKGTLEGKPADILLTEPPEEHSSSIMSGTTLLERMLREGQVTDVELYFSTADGDAVPMSLSASTLEDDNGMPTGIVCVAKDISERKRAESRAAFLHSLLRHDLGNSLQVSKGFLEVLEDEEIPDDHQRYVDRSLGAIDDAIELIENVRTLNRIDGSESLRPVNVAGAIESAVERHQTLRDEMDVTVQTDIESASVMGGKLLTEVFANLIENALVHSNADRLAISTDVSEETVSVRIEDDGVGLPEDEKERIFERGYSRGESSGSGLGMYIVNQLVDTYEGDVTVGKSDRGGARFDVSLERAR